MFAHLSGPSSCSRGSARTRVETTTSPPCATTRGSRRLFAERLGLDLPRAVSLPSDRLRNSARASRYLLLHGLVIDACSRLCVQLPSPIALS
jgi:hypothetical protein